MVVNVTEEGLYRIRGRTYSPARLRQWIRREASLGRSARSRFCERAVLVRADRSAPYRYVQHFLQECAAEKIWKVHIAAAEKGEEK
jgi:hypothetical protein